MNCKLKNINLASMMVLSGGFFAATASADAPLGIYIGAGGGESQIRADKTVIGDTGSYDFEAHRSAWKVIAGLRPISVLGLEAEYIDLGNARASQNPAGSGAITQVDERAATLLGVAYLPMNIAFLDIYVKAGIAHFRTAWTEVPPTAYRAGSTGVLGPVEQTSWSNDFAYGGGVQVKLNSLAVRAEYERFDASGAHPDVYSAAITWSF